MAETPALVGPLSLPLSLPLFWPVAMVAGMEKAKADLALRKVEFVQEQLKIHGGLKRIPSRASAVREFLNRGLTAEGVDLAGRVHSRDFGVLEPARKNVKASRLSRPR